MTCQNCGAVMPEGQTICTACGAPLTDAPQPQVDEVPNQTPAEEIPAQTPEAPKPKRKLGWIIALAAAAAVIAGVALSWGYIGEFMNRTFSSPADYYHQVETRSLNAGTDALAHPTGLTALYANTLSAGKTDTPKATRGSITYGPGEELTALLSKSAGVDLSWLKSAGLTYVVDSTRSDLVGAKATLQLNGSDVASLDGMYQPETHMGYFRVPELSAQYASLDAEQFLNDYYWKNGFNGITQLLSVVVYGGQSQYQTVVGSMPDPETMAALLDRYGAIIINDLTDVERGREQVTADGVTGTYTALTVRVDKATLEKILRDVLTEAADDPDIKNIVVNVARQLDEDGEAAYAEFRKSVQDILAREALIDGDMNAVMVVYVDDKGEIRGRDVRLTADGRQEITYRQLYVVKGSRFGTEIQLNVPDELVFHVNGSGTTHGDALKGTLNMQLTVGDKAMDLGTVEIDGTSKGGDFVGQMVFTPTQELLDQLMASAILPDAFRELLHDVKVIIVNQSTADRLDLKMTAFSGESELMSLLFESSPADPLELSIPADVVDMENWAGSINQFSFMTLMGNLQKAGIPMSFFTSLGGLS